MIQRSILILAVLTLVLAMSRVVSAQPTSLAQAAPESEGMSSEPLNQIRRVVAEYVSEGRLAGVVTMVLRNGKNIFESADGMLDVDSGEPIETTSIFRIASQTKLVTSVAIMMLLEEGRITLSDPVSLHLPSFNPQYVGVNQGDSLILEPALPISVWHLLTMTSGIPGGFNTPKQLASQYAEEGFGNLQQNQQNESIQPVIARLGTLPLTAQPGERYQYGFSTDVLGALIEKVSSLDLDAFFYQRIFAPLGMNDTSFYVPAEKVSRLAANHNPGQDGRVKRAPESEEGWRGQGGFVTGPRQLYSGAGGLVSTASDYAIFLQMLLNGGEINGVRILSSSSVNTITSVHVDKLYEESDFPLLKGMGWGFNVEVKIDPAAGGYDNAYPTTPGTWSWGGANNTYFWVDPKYKLIGIFMSQLSPTDVRMMEVFRNLVYASIEYY